MLLVGVSHMKQKNQAGEDSKISFKGPEQVAGRQFVGNKRLDQVLAGFSNDLYSAILKQVLSCTESRWQLTVYI